MIYLLTVRNSAGHLRSICWTHYFCSYPKLGIQRCREIWDFADSLYFPWEVEGWKPSISHMPKSLSCQLCAWVPGPSGVPGPSTSIPSLLCRHSLHRLLCLGGFPRISGLLRLRSGGLTLGPLVLLSPPTPEAVREISLASPWSRTRWMTEVWQGKSLELIYRNIP